jgi:hypothetical protein
MAYKVNYGFQKAERARAKQAKREAKAREREVRTVAGEAQQRPEGGDEADLPAPRPPGEPATSS